MGEPGGVGPELAVRAYHRLKGRAGSHALRLVGDSAVFRACGSIDDAALIESRPVAQPRVPGHADPRNTLAVTEAIEVAVSYAMKRAAAGIVTAPIQKSSMIAGGFAFPGHTEFLQHLTGADRAVMMLAGTDLRVVPLTIHVPIAAVPGLVTTRAIVATGEIVFAALKRDFGITAPRLAIAGLNPHAGEAGEVGREDLDIIAPAVAALRAGGHDATGPLPADTMFHAEARAGYDAALCMYHDQALIPIKTLSFWDGVNVTLGQPIVRTSPDHGTALNIAGSGTADLRSMLAAIDLAARMADARAR